MGWNPFKSKEVTQVATSVSRVVDNASLPDAVKTGIIKALFRESDLPAQTMEELIASLGVRAERMYRYAEDSYTWGLPTGEVYSSTQGRLQVEQVLETIENQQVSIEYSHYGEANALHIGWSKLIANHGYNPATNLLQGLSTQLGKQVYLEDMVVMVPAAQVTAVNPGRVAQWGTAARAGYTPERPASVGAMISLVKPSPINTSSTATEIRLAVTGVYKDGNSVVREFFTIDLLGYSLEANYFHAKYTVNGTTKYWMYAIDSGTYPALDNVYVSAPSTSGSYFPFTYFRFSKAAQNTDHSSPGYITSKRMLGKMGMDFDLITDSINANPQIADVEQAMMTFSVPPVSTVHIENRYLFDYFDNMHDAMGGAASSKAAAVQLALNGHSGLGALEEAANAMVIQDNRFRMILNNSGIFKRTVAGSIGSIGTYSSEYTTEQVDQETYDPESGIGSVMSVPVKMHKYKHQVSSGFYEEVVVRGLSMTYNIYGGYSTVGDEVDEILLIPIDLAVSQNYSIVEREQLYARSLHFVFNSRTITKVRWYQQEWFRIVLIIIAIVLTVMDMGADGGSWVATATGLTGTAAIVATVIVNLIIGQLLMPKIFTFLVKVLGQEAATALAIIAIAYGTYTVIDAGGVVGAPWASDLLMLSTGLQSAVIQAKFSDLLDDRNEFQKYMEEQTKVLDKAKELLDNSTVLDPITIFGEKPEDFYNRTVHYGNIGTLGINAISSYVDLALTLPKLNDTLGEELNATN